MSNSYDLSGKAGSLSANAVRQRSSAEALHARDRETAIDALNEHLRPIEHSSFTRHP